MKFSIEPTLSEYKGKETGLLLAVIYSKPNIPFKVAEMSNRIELESWITKNGGTELCA